MVVRFLVMLAWLFIACLGGLLTPIAMKSKEKGEWITALSAVVGSIFVFYAISTGMK